MSSRSLVLLACLGVGLLAGAVRLVHLERTDPHFANADQYGNLADSLAAGQGFTIRSADDIAAERVEPPVRYATAKRTPLYPLFVAGIYRLAGHQPRLALRVQCLLDALAAALAVLLALRLLGSLPQGVLVGLGYAIYLPEFHMVIRLWTEPLFTVLLLLGSLALLGARTGRPAAAFTAGLLRGLGTLCRPGLALFPLLEWTAAAGGERRARARRVVLYAAGFVFALSPWLVRNAMVFDGWIGVTTFSGYNLYVGHDATRNGRYYDRSLLPPALEARLAGTDEVEQDRILCEAALERIVANGFWTEAELALRKVVRFFFNVDPVTERPTPASLAVNLPLLLLAAAGAWRWTRRRPRPAAPLGLVLLPVLYFVILQSAFVARMRFLFPLLPYVLILAVHGATGILRRPRTRPGMRT